MSTFQIPEFVSCSLGVTNFVDSRARMAFRLRMAAHAPALGLFQACSLLPLSDVEKHDECNGAEDCRQDEDPDE